jgi:hypothetical protein
MRVKNHTFVMHGVCLAAVVLVAASPVFAYPPDPDNAALLYYQAFLLYNAPGTESFDDFARGKTGPSDEIQECLKTGRTAISYALLATEREQCNWGLVYSKGFSMALPHLAQSRSLAKLLLADARMLAFDGQYREAFERCLSTKRLARHLGDEVVISLLVRHAIDAVADDGIRDILGMTPPDPQMLDWLKGQLASVSAYPPSFARSLKYEQEMTLEMLRADRLAELKVELGAVEAGKIAETIEALQAGDASQIPGQAEEALLARNREYLADYMTTMQATLARPMPYAEKWQILRAAQTQMVQDAATKPEAVITGTVAPALGKIYSVEVKAQARANALRVGMELLTAKAQTGKLPERLPANMLKDPFSDQDYLYEKTSTGFVLRCQGKDLDKDTTYEYPFTVK